jgi:phospholipid transport system substrate-binding protein
LTDSEAQYSGSELSAQEDILRRVVRIFSVLFGLLVLATPVFAVLVGDKPAPVMMVEKLHTALLDNMKQGAEYDFAERKEKIAPVVHEVFDLETMMRASVGTGWQSLSEDDRKKLTEAFAGWTIATYASQFKAWNGEQFTVTAFSDPEKPDVMVNTEIKPKAGKTTALNYRLRQKPTEKNDGPWQVVDILLDGAVSQLALRRADFSAVFSKGGAPALIAHLQALTDKLEAAA